MVGIACLFCFLRGGRGGQPLLMLFYLIDFQTSTILQSELHHNKSAQSRAGGGETLTVDLSVFSMPRHWHQTSPKRSWDALGGARFALILDSKC